MQNAVLVLNVNYEPLQVTSIHRALNLILAERASLILNGRGIIHSVSKEFPIPSIIRMSGMIHVPRMGISVSRSAVFQRDGYTCQYCGAVGGNLTIDHVIPRSRNGKHEWENVVTACAECNHKKGGKLLGEAHMHLRKLPRIPPTTALYRFSRQLQENREWYPYLESW